MKQVVRNTDLGRGLGIENNKVVVKVDELAIPVDVKLQGVTFDEGTQELVFTLSNDTVIRHNVAKFLSVDTNTKVTDVNYNHSVRLLTITDSDNNQFTANLTELFNAIADAVSPLETRVQALEQRENLRRGEELQDLAGNTLGYLIAAD